MNAFNTTGPSIFATDRAFTAQRKPEQLEID